MLTYQNILDLTPDIQEKVRQWRNSDHVRYSMLSSENITAAQHKKWISWLAAHPERQVVRITFENKIPFGVITLKDIDRNSSRSDWGIYIGDTDFLGRGLARIMLFDLLTWAFDGEKLERLYTSVLGNNVKAMMLYLEYGFHLEGRFEKHVRGQNRELLDIYWFALFAEGWGKIKGRFKNIVSEWSHAEKDNKLT